MAGSGTSVSADGRYIAFASPGTATVLGETNPWDQIFVRDVVLGSTTLVSATSAGVPGNDHSF